MKAYVTYKNKSGEKGSIEIEGSESDLSRHIREMGIVVDIDNVLYGGDSDEE